MKKLVLGDCKKITSLIAFLVLALCLISSFALASDASAADGKPEAGADAESESSLKIVIVDETPETSTESESSLKIVIVDETPEIITESEDSFEEASDTSSIDESIPESEEVAESEKFASENTVTASGEKDLEKKEGNGKKAKESGNVLAAGRINLNGESISIISFQDTLKDMPEDAWDMSENQDGSVMAWVKQNEDLNELIVAGEGGVDANPDSSCLFEQYSGSYINFNDCFYTGNVLNMYAMFLFCINLRDLDLSGWDTSNVTDMSYMFTNCAALENLDVSNWDTSNVTDMSYMFANCIALLGPDIREWDMTQADITEMLDETGAKWEDWEISDGGSSTDTEIETFENNGSNSLSLAYIEQLFSDRDMPFSYERNEKYTIYDKIYCEGFWELTYYESGILDFAFAGADATYDIAFYNDVTSGDGFISDVNGTKMVTATLEGSDDFNMSEQEIINDIIEAEYGEDLLDIAHILYGSEFEKDIAAIKEITENGNYSHTEFSITDAIVYTEGNVSDNFNSGELGETVNKIRYVIDTDYPSVTVSKSEIVGKIVYTD